MNTKVAAFILFWKTKTWFHILVYFIFVLVFITIIMFFIPYAIDYAYLRGEKINNPYITNYYASDLLEFWGSILSVFATVFLAYVAFQQNNRLNQINNRIMTQQIKPVLVSEYETDWQNKQTVYRVFSQIEGNIVNNGWSTQKPNNNNWCALKIKNIGLGPATNINVFLYKLVSIDGVKDLTNFPQQNISDFYKKIKFQNYSYLENGIVKKDKWQVFTTFNLGISDESNSLCMVFYVDGTITSMHNILELNYQNAYGDNYRQLIYFSFINNIPSAMPISAPIL